MICVVLLAEIIHKLVQRPEKYLTNDGLQMIIAKKSSDHFTITFALRQINMAHGIRSPAHGAPSAYTSGTFLDYFSGGWNEILPNGGPTVTYNCNIVVDGGLTIGI
jgi:hypothetical protein